MRKVLAAIASSILFIEFMDTTILYSCAVPVANDLGVSSSRMSLPIISYIIGTCLFVPSISWLANHFNRIHIIMITLLLFGLFSILCGIAPELYIFSFFRFFQGVGISIGSAMIILTLLCVCPKDEIVATMATINIPALFGTAIGPFIGALFSHYVSWRIAFIINFPICIALLIILMSFKNRFNPNELSPMHFDKLGFSLISLFLVFISIGFERLGHQITYLNIFIVFVGILFGIAYVLIWQIRKNQACENNSILDLTVFANRDFLLAVIVNICARASMCGIPLLISLILQQLYGYSVIDAGIYLAIIAGAAIIAKLLSTCIVKVGVHNSVILYVLFTGVSIFLLSFIHFWIVTGCLWFICFCFGFMMSLLYTSMNSLFYISIKNNEIPNATNVAKIIQQFSIGLGIVLAIGGLNLLLSSHEIKIEHHFSYQLLKNYGVICKLLATLMFLNLIVAYIFMSHHKKIKTLR